MKIQTSLGLLLIATALLSTPPLGAHGGAFRGPGDSTPPPAGGGSSGSGGSTSSGGTSGGASQPGTSGGTTSGGSSSGGSAANAPTMPSGPAGATWEPWWAFNRDPFLNLKAVIHQGNVTIGSDTFFLGYSDPGLARNQLSPTEESIREEIVPALLRVLEKESDNDLVTGALVALAKIGEEANAGPGTLLLAGKIRPFLSSANQEIAETAAVSLGILANPQSVPTLAHLLRDTETGRRLVGGGEVHWRSRAFAAYGLGLVGYRSGNASTKADIVAILKDALEGGALKMATPDVAVACLTALGLVPLEVDTACKLVTGGQPGATECRHGQVQWVREIFKLPAMNDVVKAHVPTILARLVSGDDVDSHLRDLVARDLIGLAGGKSGTDRKVQLSAVMALGQIGTASTDTIDVEISKTLMEVARTARQPQVRTLALVSLGQVDGRVGATATDAVRAQATRRFLSKELSDGRSSDRAWVSLAISLQDRFTSAGGGAASAEVANQLRTALKKAKSPSEVGAYSVALGIVQDVESESVLREKLGSVADDRARGYIALGLGLMNARASVGELGALIKEARYRPILLRETAISLGLLGDKDVVLELIAELQRASSLTAQSSIASALGAIGDARSVSPLVKMLEDPEVNVRGRAFAAVALGIVADKEPMPWNAKIALGANYLAGTTTLTDGLGGGILDIL